MSGKVKSFVCICAFIGSSVGVITIGPGGMLLGGLIGIGVGMIIAT